MDISASKMGRDNTVSIAYARESAKYTTANVSYVVADGVVVVAGFVVVVVFEFL